MKKKILLLLLTSFSTVSAIAASIAVASSQNEIFSIRGQNEASTFVIDYSTVESENETSHTVKLKSQKGASITIGVEGALFHDNAFYAIGNNNDFYIYNVEESPIRGIASASITLSSNYGDYHEIDVSSMFSYNTLSFSEVLNGKYQDLFFGNYSNGWSSGDINLDVNQSMLPTLGNYRYFLAYFIPSRYGSEIFIKNLTLDSVCADNPPEVAIGTNEGALSDDEKVLVSTRYGNSLVVENTGNGAYFWTNDGDGFLGQYYPKSAETAPLINSITSSGFELTLSAEGTDVYQKRVGSIVHTIFARTIEYSYCKFFETQYTDEYDYFAIDTSWPGQYIIDNLSEDHQSVTIPSFDDIAGVTDNIESYNCVSTTSSNERMIGIIANFKEGTSINTIQSYASLYLALFTSPHWSGSSYYKTYEDDFLDLYVGANNLRVMIEFREQILSNTPPTQEDIASQLGVENSELIYIVEGGENARYISFNRSYRIYHCAESTVANALAGLLEAGYNYVDGHEGVSYYYQKNINFYSYITIAIVINSDYIGIDYYYSSGREEYSSLYDLMFRITPYNDEITNNILSDVTISENFKYYYIYNNRSGYVSNAGSDFISEITASGTYIEIYDAYKFDNNRSDLLKFSVVDGGVLIEVVYAQYTEFYDYEVANNRISSFVSGLDESLGVYFKETDNLGNRFRTQSNRVLYFGSLEEVNDVKQLFIDRINSNGKFVYSSYQNKYFNIQTHIAYYLDISRDRSQVYRLSISFDDNEGYVDFDSFNGLNLGENTILENFPAFVSEAQKDEKYFVINGSDQNSITLDVAKSAGFDSGYVQTLLEAGFSNVSGNVFSKIIGAYEYKFEVVGESTNYWTVRFSTDGPWYNMQDFLAILTLAKGEDYVASLENFGFSENFSSETPAYYYDQSNDLIRVADLDEIDAYYNYLNANGYEYVNDEYYGICGYARMNAAKTEFFVVDLENRGSFYTLNFEHEEMDYFTTWESVEESLSESVFNYETISGSIPFPSDFEGDAYCIEPSQLTSNSVTFLINKNYDLSDYVAALANDEEYISGYSSPEDAHYELKKGNVNIRYSYAFTYVQINYTCYEGNNINDPIVLPAEGTYDIEYRGSLTYFAFTPSETATYSITSTCQRDTYCYLYDVNGKEITHDDDGADNNQFLIEYRLEAGVTYIIAPRLYSTGDTNVYPGTLTVVNNSYPGDCKENAIIVDSAETNTQFRVSETYYQLSPTESATYYFTSSCEFGTYADLLYENGEYLYSNNPGYDEQFYFTYELDAESTYYLRVRCHGGESPQGYDGVLYFGTLSSLSFDGDSIENAIDLDNESEVLYRGTDTYYSFTIEEEGEYYVSFSAYDTGNYQILDSDKKVITEGNFWGYSENHVRSYYETGTYYVKARLEGESNPFRVSEGAIQVHSADIDYQGKTFDDPIEINEGTTSALTLRQSYTYYVFVAPKDGYYYFTSSGYGVNTKATLYNPDQGYINGDYYSGENGQFIFSSYLYEGDTYYLGAGIETENPFATASGSITINAFEYPAHPGDAISYEIIPLEEGTINYTNYQNFTYFEFTPESDGVYCFSHNAGDLRSYIQVVDGNSNSIFTSPINNETFYLYLEAGVTYQLCTKVDTNNPFATSEASLSVEKSEGNSFNDAISVGDGESYYSSIFNSEYTYFELIPSESGDYWISVYSDGNNMNVVLFDFDQETQLDTYEGDEFNSKYELKEGHSYYVAVSVDSNNPNSCYGGQVEFVKGFDGDSIENAINVTEGITEPIDFDDYYGVFVSFDCSTSGTYEINTSSDTDIIIVVYAINETSGELEEIDYFWDDGQISLESDKTYYFITIAGSEEPSGEFHSGTFVINRVGE